MRVSSKKREEGSTLVLALVMGMTIGTVLASYLGLISSRYKVTMRSQCWNTAMPVLEAGIEEAMTVIQKKGSNPSTNNWELTTVAGLQMHFKQRSFADGSYYLVHIYNAGSENPQIYSSGFVPAPLDPGSYISRTVRVIGGYPPLFNGSFGTVNDMRLNGMGLAADSFNSSLEELSTNGQYDPKKTSTNGNVASVNGPVNFGNHSIAGSLLLGPSAAYNSSVGQVLGQISTDFNVAFPDAELPATSWYAAPTAVISSGKKTTTVHDFTTDGDYYVNDSADIIVEPGVTVRLRVDTTTFAPADIHILATNGISGTLTVYQVSGTATMAGNVVVDSGRARNFYYYGLPGVTSVTYSGTSSYIGAIYAPGANLTLNGGGMANGFIGAAVAKTLSMNGNNYALHFDEDLLTAGPIRNFVATSWREL